MIKIQSLDSLTRAAVIRCFLEAFADYATGFSEQQVSSILKFRGFDPKLSFGAFDGERLAAFVLNGIGKYHGIASAYDSGTGTLPEYRGRRLVKDLLKFGEIHLKENGIRQYVLEVLCDNAPAIHIYEGDGFEIDRELVCFGQKKSDILIGHSLDMKVEIMRVGKEILPYIDNFIDFQPSWQNTIDSMERGGDDVTCLAAMSYGKPVGVAAVNARQGDLMMLAVDDACRRRGVGSHLLKAAIGCATSGYLKILNVDSRCGSMLGLLNACNIPETVRQYEMIKSFG